jgi:hypothetical protein
LADSFAWQNHLPDATSDDSSLLHQARVQYKLSTGASTEEKTQAKVRLAGYLEKAPNSKAGVHEFGSPVWLELSALTKVERTLGKGLSTIVANGFHYFFFCHLVCSVHALHHDSFIFARGRYHVFFIFTIVMP